MAVADGDNAYLALVALGTELKAKPVIREDEVDDAAAVGEAGAAATEVVEPETGLFGVGGGSYEAKKTLRERLLNGEAWTPERIAKWGADLDAVADRARVIAAMPLAQGSRPRSFAEIMPSAELREVTRHLLLAAWVRWETGRRDEAAEVVGVAWKLGLMVRDARGPLIDYLIGIAGMGMSEEAMRQMAARAEVEAGQVRAWLGVLSSVEPWGDSYAHTLKNEASLVLRLLSDHTAGEAAESRWGGAVVVAVAKTRVLFPLIYKRNITVGIYADHVRHQLGVPELKMADLLKQSRGLSGCPHCDGLLEDWWRRPYNLYGQVLVSMVAPSFSSISQTRLNSFSRTSLTRTFLALRLWHLERGALPERLDELVPEYLPAVPVDYVDGAPIRYSRELGVVWSAGEKNLVISAADQEIHPREMVGWLTFAESED